MSSAQDYAQWIVNHPELKGTPQFNTVATAYKEAKAMETLESGSGEYANESVLYDKPQAGVGRKLLQSAGKGIVGALDTLIGAPEATYRMGQWATTKDMPLPRYPAPLQTKLIEKGIFTPEAEFNTPIGKVADVATQMYTGGGFNPVRSTRSLMNKPLAEAGQDIARQFAQTGVQGVTAGTTSEALKSIGVDNPLAQFALTGTATAASGAPFGIRNTPSDIVNKGLQGVTPEQIQMANALMKKAASIGAPITGAEAIAQVTGNKALLGTQRFVENAQESQPIMNQFMAGRPAGQRQAFESSVNVIGLPPNYGTPANLEQTAGKVIKGAESSVTSNLNPYFKEAGKQAVPNTDIAGMMTNPRIADAVEYVRSTGKYGVKNEPANSVKTLIAAKQYLDDEYSKQMNAVTGAEKNASRVTWSANRQLDDFLNRVSPEYAQGSRKFEIAQNTQIQPLKNSLVGAIAEGANAAETLMPAKPVNLYPADIKRTVELLRRKDPEAIPSWTRQQLESTFNETAQNLQGGPNQFGGPKFAATVTGNKQQRDNLRTLVTESSGMQAWKGFEDFLDVMEAQGQRMPANSATTFNEMARQEMGAGLLTKATTPITPSRLTKGLEQWQMGNNAQKLAKLLTDPDSVNKLEELARTGPKSARGQIIINSLIGGYTAQKPEITEEQK